MESLRVIGLSMLLLGANVALYGQQIAGSIVGNVTDAPGSAVPEAQITVKTVSYTHLTLPTIYSV